MVLSPRAPATTVSEPSVIFSPSLWYLLGNHTYHIHESVCQIIKHSDNQTTAVPIYCPPPSPFNFWHRILSPFLFIFNTQSLLSAFKTLLLTFNEEIEYVCKTATQIKTWFWSSVSLYYLRKYLSSLRGGKKLILFSKKNGKKIYCPIKWIL